MREVGRNQGRWKLLGSEKWLTAHYKNPRREPNSFSHSFFPRVFLSFSNLKYAECPLLWRLSLIRECSFWLVGVRRRDNSNSSDKITKENEVRQLKRNMKFLRTKQSVYHMSSLKNHLVWIKHKQISRVLNPLRTGCLFCFICTLFISPVIPNSAC